MDALHMFPCIFCESDTFIVAVLTQQFEFGGLALALEADRDCADRLFADGVSSLFHHALSVLFMDILEQFHAWQQMQILMWL